MSIITIIIALVIIGFVMWIINTYIPMASGIKAILNGLVVILVILWLLSIFGVIHIGAFNNFSLK